MVGGLWRIDNDNGSAVAYESLHLNSSRTRTEYPSYPMPADWPDFPSHQLVGSYFEAFAADHDLHRRVTFRTEVTCVEPVPTSGLPGSAGWLVTTRDGQRDAPSSAPRTRRYQHVLVASGHHAEPQLPALPGQFTGRLLHTHAYREPSVFSDADVLVVGVGNSGMDVACDAVGSARRVLVSTRHGVHVIPRYVLGRPLDRWTGPLNAYVPFAVERRLYEWVLRLAVGRPEDRGMPRPDHRLLSAHPTVSAMFLDLVGQGDIAVKPDVVAVDGELVTFGDGSREHVDVLVLATGYRVTLPFLPPDVLDTAGNQVAAYLRVVPPERPGLWLLGFVQTVGSNIPLMEMQAEWVGDCITGAATLPSPEAMWRWIDQDSAATRARYVRSERHTMHVDFWRYARALRRARAGRDVPGESVGSGAGAASRLTRRRSRPGLLRVP